MTSPVPRTPHRRIVLIAGPSGSGKGVMTQRSGLPLVPLDEFYRDHDDPGLPHRFGIVDWDDPASWDGDAALAALTALAHDGTAEVPRYSISQSRRIGTHTVDATSSRLIVAEGIFASELVEPLRAAGILADALVLSRPASLVFTLRLARDLREGRKRKRTLVRRGWALAREQSDDIATWESAGMRRVGLHEGLEHLRALVREASPADGSTGTEPETPAAASDVPATVLRIAAVCFVRIGEAGLEVLAVRKRDTGTFMQPGGKLEEGESARSCAVREIIEELDVVIDEDQLEHLGEFRADAANEPDTTVEASVFLASAEQLPRDVSVYSEIEEAVWCPVDEPPADRLWAPLMTEHILPTLRALAA